MFAIAMLLTDDQPARQLIGAAPLAAMMAAARLELGRERASSRVAAVPNSTRGSAPRVRAERQA